MYFLTTFPHVKTSCVYWNLPSLLSNGIGGTSSSQSVSAEPRLADNDGVGSRTCGLIPAGELLDSRDSVEERPLSAAKLSVESETSGIVIYFVFQVQGNWHHAEKTSSNQ